MFPMMFQISIFISVEMAVVFVSSLVSNCLGLSVFSVCPILKFNCIVRRYFKLKCGGGELKIFHNFNTIENLKTDSTINRKNEMEIRSAINALEETLVIVSSGRLH